MTPPPAQPLSLRLDNVLPMVNPRHVQLIGPQVSTGPPLAVFRILVGDSHSSRSSMYNSIIVPGVLVDSTDDTRTISSPH